MNTPIELMTKVLKSFDDETCAKLYEVIEEVAVQYGMSSGQVIKVLATMEIE